MDIIFLIFFNMLYEETAIGVVLLKKFALKNLAELTGKYLCRSLLFWTKRQPEAYNFMKKESPTQVMFC